VDFEKQKASIQSAAMNENPAIVCAIGIHPNMVSSHRISDKQLTTWMEEISVLSKSPYAVAIDCGLDFSREYSTWFVDGLLHIDGPRHLQEKAFSMQVDLASILQLPLIVHDISATERFHLLNAHLIITACAK
jgi:Tat protein secretion system quality control protein TatD with DNase activity